LKVNNKENQARLLKLSTLHQQSQDNLKILRNERAKLGEELWKKIASNLAETKPWVSSI